MNPRLTIADDRHLPRIPGFGKKRRQAVAQAMDAFLAAAEIKAEAAGAGLLCLDYEPCVPTLEAALTEQCGSLMVLTTDDRAVRRWTAKLAADTSQCLEYARTYLIGAALLSGKSGCPLTILTGPDESTAGRLLCLVCTERIEDNGRLALFSERDWPHDWLTDVQAGYIRHLHELAARDDD